MSQTHLYGAPNLVVGLPNPRLGAALRGREAGRILLPLRRSQG